jgi:2-dehydropantoate 2-reductase
MKIAVIGAGAIGGLVAGYLFEKGEDVFLVGHPASVSAIRENGLRISGARGSFTLRLPVGERMESAPDLAILATKTQDLAVALKENLTYIRGSVALTTQNGLQADEICARFLPRENIVSSIVMFGATSLEPGVVVHNFERSWVMGTMAGATLENVYRAAEVAGKIFPAPVVSNIKGMKWLKVFVNSNNCIPGILGVSMQEAFADFELSRICIEIWREGLNVVEKAGVVLETLPDFPLERLIKLTQMPAAEAAKVFSGIMTSLSKEPLYGSIFQSIKRGKSSEIDYINGEFVSLARKNAMAAPLNEKLVSLVHEVEKTKRFFTTQELIDETRKLL